jgi:hypothetical protein
MLVVLDHAYGVTFVTAHHLRASTIVFERLDNGVTQVRALRARFFHGRQSACD